MADALYLHVGPRTHVIGTPAYTNLVIDDADESIEFYFNVPEAITITKIGVRMATDTAATPEYKISIQGVDASGVRDGTIKGGASPAEKTIDTAVLGWTDGSFYWVTLDNSYTTTRGEILCIHIGYTGSQTIDATNYTSFSYLINNNRFYGGFPYAATTDSDGTRTKSSLANLMPIVGYASASKAYGWPAETSNASGTIQSDTSPDEVGLKFIIPADWGATFKVVGFHWYGFNYSAGGSMIFSLYNSSMTVLQDITMDSDIAGVNNSYVARIIYFDETTLSTLNCGDTYYLMCAPQDAALNLQVGWMEVDAAADWDAYPMGQNWHWVERTDAGELTLTTTRRPHIELILSDITEPAGGGSSPRFGDMTGGLR